MFKNFVHLHGHSVYSVLDGLSKIEELFQKADKFGMPAFAVTDHASISSLPTLFKTAEKYKAKPLIGCEFYVVDNKEEKPKKEKRYHLIVIAKNWEGVLSINKQLTKANRFFHRRPRLDWKDILDFDNCIISTACSSGVLSHSHYEEIVHLLSQKYKDDFYLELMPFQLFFSEEENNSEEKKDMQLEINNTALLLSKKYNIKCIVTNDYHYVDKEDAKTHEVLLAIQRKTTMNDPKRWKFDCEDVYFKNSEEMWGICVKLFGDENFVSELFRNNLEVADKCNVIVPKFPYSLPNPYDGDEEVVFLQKIREGWLKKIKKDENGIYKQRLEYEISVIKKSGFIKYFLIVEDVINFAFKNNIGVNFARGSAAGSLVAYLLGITFIDPIEYNLFFERFLNPSRVSMPDIDLDFQDNRRQEIFDYIVHKYGEENTAKINTNIVLQLKSTFRDVLRTFEFTPFDINKLSTLLDETVTLEENIENNFTLKTFFDENPNLLKHVQKLNGVIRAQGVHAAGIVVSSEPLVNRCVIEYRSNNTDGCFVTNWDKDEVEKNGFLKIDILGLSSLSVVKDCLTLIKERKGIDIDIYSLPFDDKRVFDSFLNGLTVGTFQFENNGMRQLLKDIKADSFEKLYHATALFRPGSLDSGETQKYINIVNNLERADYYNNVELKNILGKTYSTLVFQEQIMAIFNKLAGFSLAEADTVRKIIGKKLGVDKLREYEKSFIEGCANQNTLKPMQARELFDKIVSFAQYSFNKSHAVAYTALSYVMQYLKIYYPLEFFVALLNAGREDKVKGYIREAARLGISIKMPNINYSGLNFIPFGDDFIIAPFTAIKGVGIKSAENIIEERDKNGFFKSYDDFLSRVNKRLVNIRVQNLLHQANVFESIGYGNKSREDFEKFCLQNISIYDDMPEINITKRAIPWDLLFTLYDSIVVDNKTARITPVTSKKPSIMLIVIPPDIEGNGLDNGNFKMMRNKSTVWFFDLAKRYGYNRGDFYITSATKYAVATKNPYDPSKIIYAPDKSLFTLDKCVELVEKEIKLVQPSFIFCLNSFWVGKFLDGKQKLDALKGTVEWSSKYNTPVGFSQSLQYCFYNSETDVVEKLFEKLNIFAK